MVKFQSHRFVFHLEDHRSISEPRIQLWTQPTKLRLQTNFVPSQVSSGVFATQPLRTERGKSQRAFSLKFDGLLPSRVSPPPLPLGWPRRPRPSDPSSAGPCLQTEGRWGASTENLRGLRAPKAFMPSVGRTRGSGQPPPPPTRLPRPPYPERNWQAGWGSDPITRLSGCREPAPLSLGPRIRTLGKPSPPTTPHLPSPLLPPLLPKSPRRNGRELRGTRAWLQHFGNERNCRRAPEPTVFKELLYSIKTATCLLAPVC